MKTLTLRVNLLAQDSQSVSNDPSDRIQVDRPVQEAFTSASRTFPIAIPNSTVDQVINLPAANVDYLLVHVDQQVTVKLNGSSTAFTLKPTSAGIKTPVLLLRGSVSALTVSNSSGQAANLDVIAVML